MLAEVVRHYTDRIDGAVHLAGERVELTQARAAELGGAGFVRPVGGAPAEAAPKARRARKGGGA